MEIMAYRLVILGVTRSQNFCRAAVGSTHAGGLALLCSSPLQLRPVHWCCWPFAGESAPKTPLRPGVS